MSWCLLPARPAVRAAGSESISAVSDRCCRSYTSSLDNRPPGPKPRLRTRPLPEIVHLYEGYTGSSRQEHIEIVRIVPRAELLDPRRHRYRTRQIPGQPDNSRGNRVDQDQILAVLPTRSSSGGQRRIRSAGPGPCRRRLARAPRPRGVGSEVQEPVCHFPGNCSMPTAASSIAAGSPARTIAVRPKRWCDERHRNLRAPTQARPDPNQRSQ